MSQELLDVIAAEKPQPVDLTVVREKAKELRDSYLRKNDLENQLKEQNKKIIDIERNDLPALFTQAGISSVTIERDGNHPGFVAERKTVYSAKLPEDDNMRLEALAWFDQQGHGDLVKSVFTIQLGMHEHEEKLRIMKVLKENNIPYYTNESVHHMTLKAFVKTELQAGHIIPMDLLGAYIFEEVKIKEEKMK